MSTQTWLRYLRVNAANIVALVCAAVMIGAVLLTTPWAENDETSNVLAQLEAAGIQLPEGVDAEAFAERMAQRAARQQQGDAASTGQSGDLMPAGQADASADTGDLMPAGQADASVSASDQTDQASTSTTAQWPAFGGTGLVATDGSQNDLDQYMPYLVAVGALIAGAVAIWDMFASGRRVRYLIPASIAAGGVVALLYFGYFFLIQGNGAPGDLGFWVALAGTAGLFAQVAVPRPRLVMARPSAKTSSAPRPRTAAKSAARPAKVRTASRARPVAPAALPVKASGVVRTRSATPASTGSAFLGDVRKGTSINVIQNIRIAIGAVMANKLRSALTMLGIIIGVAAVVSLISVGQSARASVTGQIEGAGANQVTVMSRGRNAASSLTLADTEAIAQIPGVAAVAPQNSGMMTAKAEDSSVIVSVIGTTEAYAEANVLGMALGRFLTGADDDGSERVAVLGAQTAEDLFGGLNPVGREVRINNVSFEVAGVVESGSSTARMGDPDAVIFVPLSTASRRLFRSRSATGANLVSTITVLAQNSDDIPWVMDQIELLLRDLHGYGADENIPFGVMSQSVLLETVESVYSTVTVFLGAIAGISLLVGGIGIMNITLVSVTERTKEIGLRKAVGAQHVHILVQFLIETVVLSATGGIIGILVSAVVMVLINASGLMDASLSMIAVVLGFGFSVLVGVVFGLYPANRAARLQPIEALRYE